MTSKIVVNNIESDSGISSVTFTSDIELGTKNLKGHNLESTGIVTAVSFTGSGANLTNLPAGNLSGTLPAISAANLTNVPAANITGTLPAIDGSNLTGVGASFGNSSVNTSGIITATAFVPTQGQLSHRNLVTNGSMQVAQRGTSSTSSGMKTIDRWTMNWSGGGVTQSQVSEQSGTVFENGFSNYLRITNTSNTTTDTDYRFIGHTLEAQFVANSGWNHKSPSSYVTLSAWVRSSLAGTYYGWLNSRDGSGHTYTFSYTLSANTWTKVIKTIPGNSNVEIHNNTEEGLVIHFIPWYGTYYSTSGHTLDAWQTSSSTNRCPDYSQNWANTSNATFDVTGVQLEVGSVATPFELRSEAEEFIRCQRYFQKDLNRRAYWGSGNVSGRYFPVHFITEMRATPSISFHSTSLDSGSASAHSATRQGYNFNMSGSGRFYEWAHTASAEL